MEYTVIGILAVLIIASCLRKKYILNPVTIFSGIWMIELFLAKMSLYSMIGYTEKAVYIILLGNIGFFIGSFFNGTIQFKVGDHRMFGVNSQLNIGVIKTCVIIAIICSGILVVQVLRLLLSGGSYGLVRDMLFGYDIESKLLNSGFFMLFFTWVVSGIVYALMPILLVEFVKGTGRKEIIIPGLLAVAMYTFASAGRATIFVMIIQLVVLVRHFRVEMPKKLKRIAKRFVLIGVILLILITAYRLGTSQVKRVNSVYSYFSISVPLLSHWVDFVDQNGLHTYGGTSIYGIESILEWAIGRLGIWIPGYQNLDYIVNLPQNEWVFVFKEPWTRYNAFASVFYNFYTDFGMPGVLILSALYSSLVNLIFNWMRMQEKSKSLYFYVFIIQMLVLSIIKLPLANPPYIIAIFILSIAVKSIKGADQNIEA